MVTIRNTELYLWMALHILHRHVETELDFNVHLSLYYLAQPSQNKTELNTYFLTGDKEDG